jgi:hypothetical protein
MKLRYIFLLVSLFLIVGVTYLMNPETENTFIEETKQEIEIMHMGIGNYA